MLPLVAWADFGWCFASAKRNAPYGGKSVGSLKGEEHHVDEGPRLRLRMFIPTFRWGNGNP